VDPRNRPASALAVAAALPGGDPLAAALAAGDTPTPAMVAASGDTEGISVRAARIWLALILVGLIATVVLGAKTNVLRQTPFEKSPTVLEERARNLIQSFGYAEPPADGAYGFRVDAEYALYAERQGNTAAYRDRLARGEPAPIQFWYRQSPQSLVPLNYLDGLVSRTDPPPIASGMVGLTLDPQGRLIQFDAVPPQVEMKPESSRPDDWPGLFAASGLDLARFTPDEPQWVPLGGFDTRAAWTGSYPQSPDLPLRVEAASWRGKPVFFRVIGPWSRPERLDPSRIPAGLVFGGTLIFALCALAALLAWRNFHAGRADIRGASRLAAFVFGVEMLIWVCTAHHVSTIREMDLFQGGVMWATFLAGMVWTFYLALEPYVRRRWPQSMVTWTRVLAGEFRDPMVGGHVLAAVALGMGGSLFNYLQKFFLDYDSLRISPQALTSVLDARHMMGALLSDLINGGIWLGLALVFVFAVLRALLRKQGIAVAVFVLLFGAVTGLLFSGHPVIGAGFGVLAISFFLTALLRFGVLAAIVCIFVPPDLPLTTDLSVWYSGPTVFVVAIVLALTAYASHTAVAGRALFKAGFLDPD